MIIHRDIQTRKYKSNIKIQLVLVLSITDVYQHKAIYQMIDRSFDTDSKPKHKYSTNFYIPLLAK